MTGDRRDRVRGAGWEYVHVCVDDCSRVAYAEVLGDERGATVAAFLRRAVTKTMLREWAYAVPYPTSARRTRALLGFLHRYNWHRQHDALGGLPPISRVVPRDDLLRLHT